MYDKINIYIPRKRDTPDIRGYLSNGGFNVDMRTGEICPYGYINGMKVRAYSTIILVSGSLSRLLYPNNIYPLDKHSTKDAIEKLSDNLHIDFTEANVSYLEYGTQFPMKQQPEAYFSMLGDMPRLTRLLMTKNSLYYRQRSKHPLKEFVFYDKRADADLKDMELPVGFEDMNLLKFEMRLKGRIKQQLKVPEVKASTLYDDKFYRLLMQKYQDSYFSITKMKQIRTDIKSEIKTVSDALDVLFARLISNTNADEIKGFIDDLKQSNVFQEQRYYTRLKKKIQEITSKGGATESNELEKELDDAIKNVGAYV